MKYISAESSTKGMSKEFLEIRDRIIAELDNLPTTQRCALLMLLMVDAAMLLKYEKKSLNSNEDILLAVSNLWVGPMRDATLTAADLHIAYLEKTKGTKH